MQIYDHDARPLHELVKAAASEQGATLLVPDLQRPYVWSPNQVVLLVDSLLRGWPFGTLLLWDVKNEKIATIPSRPFWKVVDRTAAGLDKEQVSKSNPPAEFRMVLDGQQRLQSLLLGFGGDAWGFRLLDREWSKELEIETPKGKNARKHWSLGHLCLDLEQFRDLYFGTAGEDVAKVEFRDALEWVVVDPTKGRSTFKKPPNYKEPLPSAVDHPGRYLRISRLYQLAAEKSATMPKDYAAGVKATLATHSVADADKLRDPLAELVFALRRVQEEKVSFLWLKPFDESAHVQDVYRDAIVNIFTRLNTAGRALTRQEITFAWIKMFWDSGKTEGRSAGECFEVLAADLKGAGIDLEMDAVVSAVSAMWSVLSRQGEILSANDLLRREKVGPMAQDLVPMWGVVSQNAIDGALALGARGLKHNEHYASVNVLTLLLTWRLLARRWRSTHALGVTDGDAFDKRLDEVFAKHADRWMILSQWSGRWGKGTAKTFADYARDLAADWAVIRDTTALDDVFAVLEQRMALWIEGLRPDALAYVDGLGVTIRDAVHQYFLPLWLWHRLDDKKWKASQLSLRDTKRGRIALDVDHVVAVKLWETLAAPASANDDEGADLQEILNSLGNCCLLEKSFNIAKGAEPLAGFLGRVHEFKTGVLDAGTWSSDLAITAAMLDPKKHAASFDDVKTAVEQRTALLKSELRQYVKGEIDRADT